MVVRNVCCWKCVYPSETWPHWQASKLSTCPGHQCKNQSCIRCQILDTPPDFLPTLHWCPAPAALSAAGKSPAVRRSANCRKLQQLRSIWRPGRGGGCKWKGRGKKKGRWKKSRRQSISSERNGRWLLNPSLFIGLWFVFGLWLDRLRCHAWMQSDANFGSGDGQEKNKKKPKQKKTEHFNLPQRDWKWRCVWSIKQFLASEANDVCRRTQRNQTWKSWGWNEC